MKISQLTGKQYEPSECVYISNPTQCAKYCKLLGTEFFMDILFSSEKREDALVYVWKKCPETKEAKRLWDERKI